MTAQDSDDRFGVSQNTMKQVFEDHAAVGLMRDGCYVPTRNEVATLPPERLISILNDWFWESPTELIPTPEQESDVLAILKTRPDAAAFAEFIAENEKPAPLTTQKNDKITLG